MDMFDDIAENARRFARRFTDGALDAPPARRLVIVTCMDARIDPARLFGLEPGDAHVLRNAGAVVTDDVIRSLVVSQRRLGTDTVWVIGHTECGLLDVTDDGLRDELERETGLRPTWVLGAFTDLAAEVRQSIAQIRSCRFLPSRERVRGFVYDVRTGRLHEVVTEGVTGANDCC